MTPEQRANLAKLTLYVASLPPDYAHFEMKWFVKNGGKDGCDNKVRTFEPHCGTAACFAGHGPNAGVLPQERETWGDYVVRCFGCKEGTFGLTGNFNWLFGIGWENETEKAVKRAAWYLQNGNHPLCDEQCDGYEDGRYKYHMEWEAPEGWDSFTPDMELITRIAKGEA